MFQHPLYYSAYDPGFTMNDANYIAWQQRNEDMAAAGFYTNQDAFMPTCYTFLKRSIDGSDLATRHGRFIRHTITETRRLIRKYGGPNVVVPFISWTLGANGVTLVDHDIWEDTCRICYQEADGFVLWGGFGVSWNTDKVRPWWLYLEGQLLSGRYWQDAVPR